jgi:hypothetical protein
MKGAAMTDDHATDELLQTMLATEGTSMTFEVERDLPTVDRDGLSVTFSEEALNDLYWRMALWVGTRVRRRLEETGIGPQAMRVTVNVDLDQP